MSDNPLANASFSVRRRDSSTPRRLLKRLLPGPVRQALRFGYSYGLDAVDFCRGRRRDLMPPRYLNFAGDGDFEKTGNEFLTYFIQLCGLRPSYSVLDVGCGIGRMARALTGYLDGGTYEGFDIVPAGIRWCQKNITPRYPRFHFALADIRNTDYNPQGKLSAEEYRFPYGNTSFDFAFLTSVFTHLLPADAEHYLAELSRVLRPGAKCLATFFLLNEEANQRIADGSSSLLFHHPLGGCWTINPEIPESAVAYDERKIGELLENNGFALESTHYGKWCGRSEYLSYQDLYILRKRES